MAFLQRLVLGDGVGVDRAHAVELFAQGADEFVHAGPVGFRAGLLGQALVEVEEGMRLGGELPQVHVEALADVCVEVFLPQTKLRLADLVPRAAVVPAGERLAAGAEVGVEGLGGGGGLGVFVAAGSDDLVGGGEVDPGELDFGVERGGLGAVAFQAASRVRPTRGGGVR